MNKVLNRALFTKPKQEHRSTGITSGLKYRQNYRVGGRVGFKNGLSVNEEALQNAALSFNPELSFGKGPDLSLPKTVASTGMASGIPSAYVGDYDKFKVDYNDPKFMADRSALRPTGLDTVSKTVANTLAEYNKPTQGRTLGRKSMVNTAVTNFLNASIDDKATRKKLDALDADDKAKIALKASEQEATIGLAKEQRKETISDKQIENLFDLKMKNATAGKEFAVNNTMGIIRSIYAGSADFEARPEKEKGELLRFAQLDELQNNIMTKEMAAFNRAWEEENLESMGVVLSFKEQQQKREALISHLNNTFVGFDFNLIFPKIKSRNIVGTDDIVKQVAGYNSELDAPSTKILNENATAPIIQRYLEIKEAQKNGSQFYENQPIEEALQKYINGIEDQLKIKLQ
tara:strand:- start:4465 stop:5673 length:1209 start_codon:yes stop_codon:yes gene_type:complete